MLLHKEVARARAADSAMSTEESCRVVVVNMLKGGWMSVLTIKTPNPALLGGLPGKSGSVEASV
jgi:hypothetical protein